MLGCQGSGARMGSGGWGGDRGVPWTILAIEVAGPYRAARTEEVAGLLKRVKGLNPRDLRVSHDSDEVSRIYYGTYRVKRDPETLKLIFPEALSRDVRFLGSLQFGDGRRHLAYARPVRMPTPDVGNPDWDLRKNPGECTLQFAVFEADAVENCKAAAAQLCERMRREGYETWYYHGDVASMVTVGSFRRDEVQTVGGAVVYGPHIREVMAKSELFQYNITNGNRLIVHKDGASAPVASRVVFVPGKAEQVIEKARFMDRLLIATTNPGKAAEIQALLGPLPAKVVTLRDFPPIPAPAETGATLEENAKLKSLYYARETGCYALADDSGLEVDALDGRPGVESARFAGPAQDDAANNAKLLKELAAVSPDRRNARFRCVVALASPDRVLAVESGTLEGVILESPRGGNGFGYDPLFLVPQLNLTTAELSPEEKNAISHRGEAVRRMRNPILELFPGSS